MLTVTKVSATSAVPKRFDGIVTEKGETITVEYKPPGQVKTAVASFHMDECIYMVGEPGFVIAMTMDPITQFVGKATTKDGITSVKTEAGEVIIPRLAGMLLSMSNVEADSREARLAERASKVRVKLPRSKRDTSEKSSKSKKSSRDDKGSRTVAKKKRR